MAVLFLKYSTNSDKRTTRIFVMLCSQIYCVFTERGVPVANSIMHFEIPADDLKRAKKFYEKAFGWKITDPWKMDYFFVETKAKREEGINGGMLLRKMPDQPFMNYITVDSIDAYCKKVEKAGGTIVLPKMEIGEGMGWIAAFKDTENNIMGLHATPKKSAAKKALKKAAKKKK